MTSVDVAREALLSDVDAADVGDHLDFVVEDRADGVVVGTHRFACLRPSYTGWRWAVTVVEIGDEVTVDEVVLLPTPDAIVAPAWVPYRDRVRSGDLTPGDLLPVADDDPRLVPTYSFGDDPLDPDAKTQIRAVAQDLGLGRTRTLSTDGVEQAAQRWYAGDHGPRSPLAQSAPHRCWSCGFMMRVNGHLALSFGVCANGDANDDGRVVSFDHGCGAHSEVRLSKKHEPQPLPEPIVDTYTDDLVDF